MLDPRHALHHLFVAKLLQGLKVEVSKALVPQPGVVIAAGCETHGLRHLHIEDVEAIDASVYLGKKATMVVSDPHDSSLDLHARAILIQLAQADDGVP